MAYLEVGPSLGERQGVVYAAVKLVGPCTNTELAQYLGWSINRVTPRVFELRQLSFLVFHEQRACRITGRMAYAWRAR